jgi:hypothetical protein
MTSDADVFKENEVVRADKYDSTDFARISGENSAAYRERRAQL